MPNKGLKRKRKYREISFLKEHPTIAKAFLNLCSGELLNSRTLYEEAFKIFLVKDTHEHRYKPTRLVDLVADNF